MTLDIMMPFYGRPDHFRAAVESVLAQTDPDWRLLVIDDHYPDERPGQWLQRLGDARIEYRRNDRNVGINVNFQAALEAARNDWLVIFGCDDIMLPRYVERVRTLAATHPAAAFLHPGTRVIDEDGSTARPLVDRMKAMYRPRFSGTAELSGQELALSLTRGNWMNFPAIAWRRADAQAVGFRPHYRVVQDLALALDLAFNGGSLVIDDEVVFEYRRHSGSVSSWRATDGSRFVEEQRFFRSLAAEFRSRGWSRAERAARLHVSSRINALTRLPAAAGSGAPGSTRVLLRHALGRSIQL
ncbi:glycosyltransferase family 2 protein [Agromyces ramosus]|uniref:Glycosyltransferase involved in cell wall biosynthesis n=1 Tax=Agromyces ramosus TaxID=33879 RepID=A0ABU0RBI3_9MICO|nr:glycosyltransferase family 2 protein [Agromyces ramosus]MDQ0895426.1 glycosyltransferase involved in cell wall biosynthesis [Agromyces ramosus]